MPCQLFSVGYYILQIELDSSRCVERTEVPVNAEIGAPEANGEEPPVEGEEGTLAEKPEPYKWRLEIFADGDLQVGNDTTEFDLEAIVMKKWAKLAGVPAAEREEKAEVARKEWLEGGDQGYRKTV